jgi:hypothetical protein
VRQLLTPSEFAGLVAADKLRRLSATHYIALADDLPAHVWAPVVRMGSGEGGPVLRFSRCSLRQSRDAARHRPEG